MADEKTPAEKEVTPEPKPTDTLELPPKPAPGQSEYREQDTLSLPPEKSEQDKNPRQD